MTRMIRPCTLLSDFCGDNIQFDAYDNIKHTVSMVQGVSSWSFEVKGKINISLQIITDTLEYAERIYTQVRRTTNEAIDAPVKLTRFLADLLIGNTNKEELLFYFSNKDSFSSQVQSIFDFDSVEYLIENGYYIKPASEQTRNYLLQFYTDGTPVKEEETNDGFCCS